MKYRFLRIIIISIFTLLPKPLFCQNTEYADYLGQELRQHQLYSFLASLFLNVQIALNGKGAFTETPNASPLSQGFVEGIAEDHGIAKDFQVKLSDGYGASFNTILIPYDLAATIEKNELVSEIDALYDKLLNSTDKDELLTISDTLSEHVGALDHEFTHYKNHDVRNQLIITSLLNIAIYVSYLTFEYKVLADSLKRSGQFKKTCYAIASSIGLTALTAVVDAWISRLQEKRADGGVRNAPHILKAMIKRYTRMQEDIKAYYRNSESWAHQKYAALLEKYPICYLLFDPLHPPLPDRVAYFQERLNALEKANSDLALSA